MRTIVPPSWSLTAALLALASSPALAGLNLFDSTSASINLNNAIVGPGSNGGQDVSLALTTNPFNGAVTYEGNFGVADFSLPGGLPEVMSTTEQNNGNVEVTAMSLPGNTADATVRTAIIEFNAPTPDSDPGNPGGTVQLREIYLYDFTAGDFSDTGFTTLTAPVQSFSQMTLFAEIRDVNDALVGDFFAGVFFPNDGSGFTPDFDTVPVAVAGFQTPTDDGANDGANTGPVILEILSVELQAIPEPSAAALLIVGAVYAAGRRGRRM